MASLKLLLETSRPFKNGTFSLVFQLLHYRKKRLIYTSFRVKKEELDKYCSKIVYVNNNIRDKYEVREINKLISQQKSSIQKHIKELELCNTPYSIDEVLLRYNIEYDTINLFNFIDIQIKFKENLGKHGTAAAYKSTRSSIEKFACSDYIKISAVDATFIHEYEYYLQMGGVSKNTICFYMRNLRSILNQAILNGYNYPEKPIFKSTFTKPQKTIKRALSRDTIRMLKELDLENNKILRLPRDVFMFSFYTRGMAFVDIAHLKKENIHMGILTYSRHKTNQTLQLTITKEIMELIEKYDSDSEYIFPMLNSNSKQNIYLQYRNELNRINKSLKIIAIKLKIDTPLTTYVARHSWATQAKECGTPTAIISEALGHTSEKTTQIYLKQFDNSTIDHYNEKITQLTE